LAEKKNGVYMVSDNMESELLRDFWIARDQGKKLYAVRIGDKGQWRNEIFISPDPVTFKPMWSIGGYISFDSIKTLVRYLESTWSSYEIK
jgi:hypothetical protein